MGASFSVYPQLQFSSLMTVVSKIPFGVWGFLEVLKDIAILMYFENKTLINHSLLGFAGRTKSSVVVQKV